MTWHIIENAGERQVVQTTGDPLEGQGEGWAVIASDVPEPPEDATWDGTQWVIDQARRDAKDAQAEVTDKQRLRQAIKIDPTFADAHFNQELQARVTTLEGGA